MAPRVSNRMQWILQQRKGQREGQAVWRGRRFHRDREALVASISELCRIEAKLDGLPDRHP
jgi:hypothetical protein